MRSNPPRKFLVPESIQTSAMDCGPASLKAVLEGFGISASYGRLREACQTDVDGTSIDTLEEAAIQMGLSAEQVIVPVDHLLLEEANALPALIVVRLPSGPRHFVILWRKHGPLVQIMDPSLGRRWSTQSSFLNDVYVHTQELPAEAWREWAGTDSFLKPLRRRMADSGIPTKSIEDLAARALAGAAWKPLAKLDAGVRMLKSLIATGAISRGGVAARVLEESLAGEDAIPEVYWSVRACPDSGESVLVSGAVLVHFQGKAETPPEAGSISPELAAALAEKPARPGRELWTLLRQDGLPVLAMVVLALFTASAMVAAEAILFRGLFEVGRELVTQGQRLGALGALLLLGAAMLLVELTTASALLRMGRKLECRLRAAFCFKIPRLGDRYLQSRPASDMAERSHNVHQLRQVPEMAGHFLRCAFEMALTVAGIGWLYPSALPMALMVAAVALGIPLLAQPVLGERDLRVRSHAGGLTIYYLDALLGISAIRAHGASQALRREQEGLLADWAAAGMGLQKTIVAIEGLQYGGSLMLAAWLLLDRLMHGGNAGGVLLLVYWVLNLPVLGQEAASVAWQYPSMRNTVLRLLEPLGAKEEPVPEAGGQARAAGGCGIQMEGVTVVAAGHRILEDVTLSIEPGSHIGIVGPSGAGKSSLVGLLLGWHRVAAGTLRVDGEPLDTAALGQLRSETVWVDPQVQLWNRSLFDNLAYGAEGELPVEEMIQVADLSGVIGGLPEGMQSMLGEGGALVSGGEGQRVRFARAAGRRNVRLAILDEPARGLDRGRRKVMLERARELWKDATLLSITHDVGDTRDFSRVLVIEGGKVVEDGHPDQLAGNPDSRYRALLDAEESVRRGLWSSGVWRRLSLGGGKLVEGERKERQHVS